MENSPSLLNSLSKTDDFFNHGSNLPCFSRMELRPPIDIQPWPPAGRRLMGVGQVTRF